VRVCGCGETLPLLSSLEEPNLSSPDPSEVRPSAGVAAVPPELPDSAVADDGLDCDASAEWSPAAMKPTSVLPTATLTPAATILPRVLKLRRAMWELWRRQVRVC
jgi:hypothetical protein